MKSLGHRDQFKRSSDYLRKCRRRYVRLAYRHLTDSTIPAKDRNVTLDAMGKKMAAAQLYSVPPNYDPAKHCAPRNVLQGIGKYLYKAWRDDVEMQRHLARLAGEKPKHFATDWWDFCRAVGYVPYHGRLTELKAVASA